MLMLEAARGVAQQRANESGEVAHILNSYGAEGPPLWAVRLESELDRCARDYPGYTFETIETVNPKAPDVEEPVVPPEPPRCDECGEVQDRHPISCATTFNIHRPQDLPNKGKCTCGGPYCPSGHGFCGKCHNSRELRWTVVVIPNTLRTDRDNAGAPLFDLSVDYWLRGQYHPCTECSGGTEPANSYRQVRLAEETGSPKTSEGPESETTKDPANSEGSKAPDHAETVGMEEPDLPKCETCGGTNLSADIAGAFFDAVDSDGCPLVCDDCSRRERRTSPNQRF